MSEETDEALRAAVATALDEVDGRAVAPSDVGRPIRLSAGANRRTYRAAVRGLGDVVVQVEREGASHGLPGDQQAVLVRRAAHGGVPVPEVLASGTHQDGPLAGHWTVSRYVPGEAVPRVVLRTLDEDGRAALLGQVAAAAVAVHRLPTGVLPCPHDELAEVRGHLAVAGPPAPAIALALRWLERHRPPRGPTGVVHGDLRLGNLLVDLGPSAAGSGVPGGSQADPSRPRLVALLDWELAHGGAVHADLGWFCGRRWRRGGRAGTAPVGPGQTRLGLRPARRRGSGPRPAGRGPRRAGTVAGARRGQRRADRGAAVVAAGAQPRPPRGPARRAGRGR